MRDKHIYIRVNGNTIKCCEGQSLESFLYKHVDQLSDVAVAVNQTIVHRPCWADRPLRSGDTLDIFTLVAGG